LQPRECNRQPNLERNPPPNPRFAVPSGFTIPTSASDASKLIQHLTAMTLIASPEPATTSPAAAQSRKSRALWMLTALWLALFVASLFSPPVLDDADGTHANAARQMLLSGDWVTLRVNNVRYLEKAPLPYWITAVSFRLFGFNTFAAHLPEALSVLLLMLLGFRWAREAYGEGAALYTGFGVLTSAGVFLFTRVFIPDVLLSLLLAAALYCFLRALEPSAKTVILSEAQSAKSKDPEEVDPSTTARALLPANLYPYAMWAALALAVLTKGLVAIVFLIGTAILFLALTGETRNWRRLKPISGVLVFLAIAAPWHILAGLRNTGGMNGHGFFWFYFINEHVLRFLGRRIPRDYNKLPGYLYWSLHLVWLFPWALFLPTAFVTGWRLWRQRRNAFRHAIKMGRIKEPRPGPPYGVSYDFRSSRNMFLGALRHAINTFAARSTLLHLLFSALVLLFFSLSTNQEYYTFPAYLPLLMLLGAALARGEDNYAGTDTQAKSARRWITFAHAAFTVLGILISIALAYGLWTSRHLAALPNVGDLLAHRGVGDYTLSMSSLFDLTGPSFAALRLPAALALAAFAVGPACAWILRRQRRHLAATTTIALTSATFLIAAHIALARFAPMLSSQDMATKIQQLESTGAISHDNILLLYGDQAYGSSIPFYLNRPLNRPALLVDGRSSSMLFGSTFPDAQNLFLTPAELLSQWGSGPRKLLFVPILHRDDVDRLLGPRAILLQETAGKALLTDRPLDK
jgi:4-amino-4-deoxy-L-arabinose transferase-like glycosyltransferase